MIEVSDACGQDMHMVISPLIHFQNVPYNIHSVVAPIVLTPPLLPPFTARVWVNPSRPQPPLPAVTSITPPPLPQAVAPISVNLARPQPPLAATIVLTPAPLPQALAPILVVISTWQPRAPQVWLSQPSFPAPVAPALAPAAVAVTKAFGAQPVIRPLVLTPPPLPVVAPGLSGDGRIVTISTSARLTTTDTAGRFGSATDGQRIVSTDASGRTTSSTEGDRL